MPESRTSARPRVVIVGAGFGGLAAAKAYLTFQRGTRLITGPDPSDATLAAAPLASTAGA